MTFFSFIKIGLDWRALVGLRIPNIEKQRECFFFCFFLAKINLLQKFWIFWKKGNFFTIIDFLTIFEIFFGFFGFLWVFLIFKASARWTDAFYKSKCPSVCPSVWVSVWSLLRYCLIVFLPPLLEVGCPILFEIQNPWGKVIERSGLRFEHFSLEVILNHQTKKCFFFFLFFF